MLIRKHISREVDPRLTYNRARSNLIQQGQQGPPTI